MVAALVREVAEETGLTVLDPGRVAFTTEAEDPSAGWSASVSTWDVAAWSGDVEPRDPDGYVLEAAWKPLEEALDLLAGISWHPLTVRYLRGELDCRLSLERPGRRSLVAGRAVTSACVLPKCPSSPTKPTAARARTGLCGSEPLAPSWHTPLTES